MARHVLDDPAFACSRTSLREDDGLCRGSLEPIITSCFVWAGRSGRRRLSGIIKCFQKKFASMRKSKSGGEETDEVCISVPKLAQQHVRPESNMHKLRSIYAFPVALPAAQLSVTVRNSVVVKNVVTAELTRGVVTLEAPLSKTVSVVTGKGDVVLTVLPIISDRGISTRTESAVGARAAVVSVPVGSLFIAVDDGVATPEVTHDWDGSVTVGDVSCDLGKLVVVQVKTDTAVSVVVRVDMVLTTRTLVVLSTSLMHPTCASLSSCMVGSDVPFVIFA